MFSSKYHGLNWTEYVLFKVPWVNPWYSEENIFILIQPMVLWREHIQFNSTHGTLKRTYSFEFNPLYSEENIFILIQPMVLWREHIHFNSTHGTLKRTYSVQFNPWYFEENLFSLIQPMVLWREHIHFNSTHGTLKRTYSFRVPWVELNWICSLQSTMSWIELNMFSSKYHGLN
jgi:hypothetical protein